MWHSENGSLHLWQYSQLLLLHMQMVSLYRDPDGDTVFTAHNNALEIHFTTMSQRDTDQADVDTLREKIKRLEDQLKKQTVVCDFTTL